MTTLWFDKALTHRGWQSAVRVDMDSNGIISSVEDNSAPDGQLFGIGLPSPANIHSHAFQRAMAGMTEARGPDPRDSFWTWRKLMYRFLDQLTPDDLESIAALVQMEMLEAGYSSVGEFHYLHHQPNGDSYAAIDEMSERIISAASTTQIGLTLLPVFYEQGGTDGRKLGAGQRRFGTTPEAFRAMYEQAQVKIHALSGDASIGVAPHSLRAVSQTGLKAALEFTASNPVHIHIAEQIAEVEEIEHAYGARPVQWLLDNHPVDQQWCLVHATQMVPEETVALARTGAVVGLCPITEANLGDGIFDGQRYIENSGEFGIGSDSNVRISLTEELRTLEYSQRLRDRGRAILADSDHSTGRLIFENMLRGGAKAIQRNSGSIEAGKLADIVALDKDSVHLVAVDNDSILDAWIFGADDHIITDVWSAGRHVVRESRHVNDSQITQRFRNTMKSLTAKL